MVICYLGIGSNLGDRKKTIKAAIRKINTLKGTKVIKVSRLIETEPVGGPSNQLKFLNGALKIKTDLGASMLLKRLKKIEKELGRIETVRYGPRAIDIDILFYADKIIKRKELTIPHPRLFERKFVIKPLSEVI